MVLKRLQNKLKEVARFKSLSYQQIGLKLNASEATVKRILNHDDVSFSRLEQLCEAVEISFYDALELSKNHDQEIYQYNLDQESFLAKKKDIFLIFRYLIMGKKLNEIENLLLIEKKKLSGIIKEMEEAKLIERHPQDRIKLLANFPYQWIPDGPLEREYGPVLMKRIVQESVQIGINRGGDEGSCFLFEWGLSVKSHKLFVKELGQVYDRYKKVAEVEIKSLDENFIPTSGMISIGKYPLW